MKAILLCAGKGLRLRPYTNNIPKCLMPIKGKPLLEIWLSKLKNIGINEFLVNTHYLSHKVTSYIHNSEFSDSVTIVDEEKLLGTAGTLIKNIDFFEGQDGMLIHADNYTLDNLNEFINAHLTRPKNCLMTMMTFETDVPQSCGIVKTDDKNIVTDFYEKQTNYNGNIANGAVYILSKDFQRLLLSDFFNATDFSREIVNSMTNKILAYKTNDIFIDIGTVKNYERVR